ncbi:unnamed protein product [Amoebophrya sp. A120]|nr:unnamed protein product [Amoebophrya sp. A120]|eukprot:GSA120T00011846001.1
MRAVKRRFSNKAEGFVALCSTRNLAVAVHANGSDVGVSGAQPPLGVEIVLPEPAKDATEQPVQNSTQPAAVLSRLQAARNVTAPLAGGNVTEHGLTTNVTDQRHEEEAGHFGLSGGLWFPDVWAAMANVFLPSRASEASRSRSASASPRKKYYLRGSAHREAASGRVAGHDHDGRTTDPSFLAITEDSDRVVHVPAPFTSGRNASRAPSAVEIGRQSLLQENTMSAKRRSPDNFDLAAEFLAHLEANTQTHAEFAAKAIKNYVGKKYKEKRADWEKWRRKVDVPAHVVQWEKQYKQRLRKKLDEMKKKHKTAYDRFFREPTDHSKWIGKYTHFARRTSGSQVIGTPTDTLELLEQPQPYDSSFFPWGSKNAYRSDPTGRTISYKQEPDAAGSFGAVHKNFKSKVLRKRQTVDQGSGEKAESEVEEVKNSRFDGDKDRFDQVIKISKPGTDAMALDEIVINLFLSHGDAGGLEPCVAQVPHVVFFFDESGSHSVGLFVEKVETDVTKLIRDREVHPNAYLASFHYCLDQLDKAGVVLNDLKPENMGWGMKTKSVKFFDFGISTILRDDKRVALGLNPTRTSLFGYWQSLNKRQKAGTPAYMSPALMRGWLPLGYFYGPKSDWFAAGLTMLVHLGIPVRKAPDEWRRGRRIIRVERPIALCDRPFIWECREEVYHFPSQTLVSGWKKRVKRFLDEQYPFVEVAFRNAIINHLSSAWRPTDDKSVENLRNMGKVAANQEESMEEPLRLRRSLPTIPENEAEDV